MDMEKLQTVGLIAYSAAGMLEWLKAGIALCRQPKAERKPEGIIAWATLPAIAMGAAVLWDGGLYSVLSNGAMAWATAQLGYPLLIKLPAEIIGLIKAKASSVGAGPV